MKRRKTWWKNLWLALWWQNNLTWYLIHVKAWCKMVICASFKSFFKIDVLVNMISVLGKHDFWCHVYLILQIVLLWMKMDNNVWTLYVVNEFSYIMDEKWIKMDEYHTCWWMSCNKWKMNGDKWIFIHNVWKNIIADEFHTCGWTSFNKGKLNNDG